MTRIVPSRRSISGQPRPSSSSTDFRDNSANLSSEGFPAAQEASPVSTSPCGTRKKTPPAVVPAQCVKLEGHLSSPDGLGVKVLLPRRSAGQMVHFPALLLTSRLSRGSFGKFHVGIDGTGRAYAVKQVRFEARAEVDRAKNKQGRIHYTAVADFHREATFLHLHSTTLSLRGLYATDDFRGFLVTDLMAGDLDGCMSFFRRNLMPSPREGRRRWAEEPSHLVYRLAIAARVMRDVGLEMGRLVDAGIGHQDIKGKNLLVSEAPHRIILADYGFASRLGANGGAEKTHMGTYAYANPEVMLGMRHRLSGDVWSLGVTLVEVLTGKVFFDLDHQDPREPRAENDCHDAILGLHEKYRSWHCSLDSVEEGLGDDLSIGAFREDNFFRHMSAMYLAMRPFLPLRTFVYRKMMHPYPRLRASFEESCAFASDLLQQKDFLGKSLAEHAEEALGPYVARASRAGRAVAHLCSIRNKVFMPDRQDVMAGVLAGAISPPGASMGRSSRRKMRPPAPSHRRLESTIR